MKIYKSFLLSFCFLVCSLVYSLLLVSASVGYSGINYGVHYIPPESKGITNSSAFNVNNTIYWNGNEWSDTRWLNLDGSNANQDIDIGSWDLNASFGNFDRVITDEVTSGANSQNYISFAYGQITHYLNNIQFAEFLDAYGLREIYFGDGYNDIDFFISGMFKDALWFDFSNDVFIFNSALRHNDYVKDYYGNSYDSYIQYDGSDMIVKPDSVGSGGLIIDGKAGIYKAWDNTNFLIKGDLEPDTGTSYGYGIWNEYDLQPTGDIVNIKMGQIGLVDWNSDYNAGEVRGFNQVANIKYAHQGNITKWTNIVSRLNQNTAYTGTIEDYYAFENFINNEDWIDINNYHGYSLHNINYSGDSNTAFECGNMTGATDNYVWKSGTGNGLWGNPGESNNYHFNGNITANYFIGDGSQLTGIGGDSNYSNFTNAWITDSGIIYNLEDIGTSDLYNDAGFLESESDPEWGDWLSNSANFEMDVDMEGNNIIDINDISASGNITANYFIGDGSQLTGISGGIWTNNSGTAVFNNNASIGNIDLIGEEHGNILSRQNMYNDTIGIIVYNDSSGMRMIMGDISDYV